MPYFASLAVSSPRTIPAAAPLPSQVRLRAVNPPTDGPLQPQTGALWSLKVGNRFIANTHISTQGNRWTIVAAPTKSGQSVIYNVSWGQSVTELTEREACRWVLWKKPYLKLEENDPRNQPLRVGWEKRRRRKSTEGSRQNNWGDVTAHCWRGPITLATFRPHVHMTRSSCHSIEKKTSI